MPRTKLILGSLKYIVNQYFENGEKMKRTYNIILLISILTLAVIASASTVKIASAQGHPGPFYKVELSQAKIGPSTAVVGQTFNVTVKLYNATHTTIPAGVGGIEIRLTWNHTLITPVSFTSKLGASNGVLTGPGIISAVQPGFYDNADQMSAPPYTSAESYHVAAASTTGPWWGDGGEVVEITFKVDLQPQPFATCPIPLSFTDLADMTATPIPHETENATLTILTMTTTPETVTYNGVNYPVSIISDSIITAPANLGFTNASITFNVTSIDGFCNVTLPKNFMWDGTLANWHINVDGLPVTSPVVLTADSTNTYLWFNFTAGDHVIMIQSPSAVPEFATTSLILLLMATTLIATATATSLRKRKLHR